MTRRPVAVVTTRCHPDLGGIESHVGEVTRRLVALGHEVEVLTTDRTGLLARVEEVDGYRIRRFRALPRERDWYASPGLAWWLLRHRYAAVHVQGIHTLVPPLAMLLAWLTRTPYLVTFHTGGATSALRQRLRGPQFAVLAPLIRRARVRIGVSEFERRRFEELAGVPVRVIRNGGALPDPGADAPAPDHDLVVSVGRLEMYKGHHRAIAALARLRRRRPGARLRILGAGPAEPALRALADELGVADAVTITEVPPLDRRAMARELAGAGAVTLLSEYEAHPVAVMEALALGRPVVVARTSGLAELESLGWARAVDLDADPDEVAEALARQLDAPVVPDVASLPTWEGCAAALGAVYDEVLLER
ncbi:glycosyltransferase family 4 protein [Nocardioides fonticola]|uniref:Glycosyltransferase family 4 protein n=1 Tax=Nocardioides fonticola TaxID=450363 RepID=A0ABP7XMD9_9ACTN